MFFINKNMTIKAKLALLTAIPLIFIFFNSYISLKNSYHSLELIKYIQNEVSKSVDINSLIHELQKERGLSVGYISSKKSEFAKQLHQQRQIVDSQIKKLDLNYHQSFKVLEELNTKRGLIDNLQMNSFDTIKYYSKINEFLISNIMKNSTKVDNVELSKLIIAYSNLIFVKEQLGIQRAIGNIIFTKKRLDIEEKLLFVKVRTKEKLYFDKYMFLFATKKNISNIEIIKNSEISQKVKQIKNMIETTGIGIKIDIKPEYWYGLSTQEINIYNTHILHASQNLMAYTKQLIELNQYNFNKILLISFIIIGFILGFSYLVQRNLINSINLVKESLNNILEHKNIIQEKEVIVDFRDMVNHTQKIYNEFKENEKRLNQSLKLEKEAKESKNLFFANMSHDIRTPLNGIIGTLNILLKTNITKEQKKYLKSCKNSSDILLGIVNDILDLSKMDTGKFTLDNQPCDIKEELKMVGGMFEANMKQKNLQYIANIDQHIPECIVCDIKRLKQVFSNLLSNAVKFTEVGSITFEAMVIYQNSDKVTIKFSVKDTGIGIAKDKQNLIFEAFTQEDSTTATKFGGTGLGTNIAKNIVELYNGKLELKSELGVGSEFYFVVDFDICDLKHKDIEEILDIDMPIETLRILVAEDDPTNQMVIEMMLEDLNIEEIKIVGNGQEAVDEYKLNYDKYDMIFLDIQMPIMGGLDATEEIRAFEKENHIATTIIVALTGDVSDKDFAKYLKIGMDDMLAKPVEEKELLRILKGS